MVSDSDDPRSAVGASLPLLVEEVEPIQYWDVVGMGEQWQARQKRVNPLTGVFHLASSIGVPAQLLPDSKTFQGNHDPIFSSLKHGCQKFPVMIPRVDEELILVPWPHVSFDCF